MRTLKISLLLLILPITTSAQWYQQYSGTTNTLVQVLFVNDQVGWTTYFLDIYKTTNGGENWQYLYTQNPIFQFSFSNELIGWMRTWTTGSTLLKTADGGENWIPVYSYFGATDYINDFEFINPDTGWFVGEQTISFNEDGITDFPIIFKETTDGGMTWIDKNFTSNHPGGLREIESIDYLNLIVAGWDTLFRTTNGGTTWQNYPLPQGGNYVIQFINMNIGWASTGGKLFKTTDGGYNWYQQAYPITSFQFISAQLGWYTYSNQIYNSTNGGSSWTLQNSNTNNTLNDIFFTDINNGWAVGQNGTILYTPNGGIPVELISFTAEALESKVLLNWSTATETNNQGFEIQKKALSFGEGLGEAWNKIGFVPGHGTTTETQHYSFTDSDVKSGKYQYKLKQIDYDGTLEYSQIVEVEIPFVNEFSLSQNYPNPFNPITKIKFTIPALPTGQAGSLNPSKGGTLVQLVVYDILGREVSVCVNAEKQPGVYEVDFDGNNLPSGVYLYRLTAGKFSETKKLVLLK